MRRANASGDPKTPQEWQEAADLADFYLTLQAAAGYGLKTHNLAIDEDRCVDLLRAARVRGYEPRPAAEVLKGVVP